MRPLSLVLASITFCFCQSAVAEETDLGKELAKAFVGSCVQALPDISRIHAYAKTIGAGPIPEDMRSLVAPPDPDADWDGWLIDRGPAPSHVLFVSSGTDSSMGDLKLCGVANPSAPPGDVVSPLVDILDLSEPSTDERLLGQRSRVWSLQTEKRKILIMATDASPMGDPGINLAALMIIER